MGRHDRADLWNPEGLIARGPDSARFLRAHPSAIIASLIILIVYIALGLSLVTDPLLSAGWQWDLANALGLIGFGGLLYLFLDVGRGMRQRQHRQLSYCVAAVIAAHVVWLWASDETLWFYLTWDGPHYMHAGWIALLLLAAIVIMALPVSRRFWHTGYQQFQRWHYWLSLTVIAGAFWHMAGSGFYISAIEALLYAGLMAVVLTAHRRRWVAGPRLGMAGVLIPMGALAFVLLKAINS